MYFNHAFRKSFLPISVPSVTLATATLGTTTGTVIELTSDTGVLAGQSVSGAGIQPGTVVVAAVPGTNEITLSLPITAALVGGVTAITIGVPTTPLVTTPNFDYNAPNVLEFAATTGVSVGMSVSGTSIPAGTTVIAVSGTLVTLSNSVTATIATTASIVFGLSVPLLSSGTTASLTAGQIGFFDAKTFAAQTLGTVSPFILAQGSYFASDVIGGNRFLGGYQESIKSKAINPRYVNRVIKIESAVAANQIQDVCVCNLECGNTYFLRLDLKGSPALRLLSHNIYRTLSAFTGCCTDDCTATCTGAIVDPTIATIAWAKAIVNDPILSQYIKLIVTDYEDNTVAEQAGTSLAQIAAFIEDLDAYDPETPWDPTDPDAATFQSCLTIEVAYIDTKFASCTFTPTDFYELMPLFVFPSLTDESGDPCNVQCFEVTETQAPAQASGVGETVLREMILDGRYLQNAYPDSTRVDSLRMREIESDPALATINRNGLYDQVLILHSVPRFNNPTGTFDNDQYLLKIHVPAGTDTTALTNFVIASTDLAQGPGAVVLETY
jgi:hypothetical protein